MIDYNFLCFREAIQQVFELRSKGQKVSESTLNVSSNINSQTDIAATNNVINGNLHISNNEAHLTGSSSHKPNNNGSSAVIVS